MRADSKSLACAFGGWIGLCMVMATVVEAADPPIYKEMPVDPPSIRGWNKARNCAQSSDPKAMLRGDAPMDPAVFDPFFNSILFPQFASLWGEIDEEGTAIASNVLPTIEDPKNKGVKWPASVLPTCRQEFIKMFINQAQAPQITNPEPFNHLNALTVQAMRTIALTPSHSSALRCYTRLFLLSEFAWEKRISSNRKKLRPGPPWVVG